MTSLRFVGDWSPWLSLAAGVALASVAWWLYCRQLREHRGFAVRGLPLLRGLAIVLLLLLLAGPVLKHRRVVGEIGRVLVCVDASQSMSVGDERLEPERKAILMSRLGLLTPDALDRHLVAGLEALRRLREHLADGLAAVGDAKALKRAAENAKRTAEEAIDHLTKAGSDSGPPPRPMGYAQREVWLNVPGWKIEELTAAPAFQGPASLVENITALAGPVDWNEHYGARLRGYLYPPVEGDYTFWITADDTAELWLSSDGRPENRKRIAAVTFWKKPEAWEEAAEQKSPPVRLKANAAYYFEVLMKENQGGDHVAVGWQIPNGPLERPIPGKRLSPYIPSGAAIFGPQREEMRKSLLEPCCAAAARQEGENTPQTLAALGAVEAAASVWDCLLYTSP
ncbi:MAG: PA14 domain-containing protein, partial [Planctomycetota bacterium]|nr:PA14 domain-containing protein [Planctomycetota bacterium]